jgi:hypothetical protein
MSTSIVVRLIAVPLTILALAATFSAAALAGGGGEPTGPSVLLTPPSVSLDSQGQALVTTTLVCWDEAATSGHVTLNVSLGQQRAGGGATLAVDCIDGAQTLTLPVASVTGAPFRPGPVSGLIEFQVLTDTQAGHGIGEINGLLRPPQARR